MQFAKNQRECDSVLAWRAVIICLMLKQTIVDGHTLLNTAAESGKYSKNLFKSDLDPKLSLARGNNEIVNISSATTAIANLSNSNNLAIYQSSSTLTTLEQPSTDASRKDTIALPNNTMLWINYSLLSGYKDEMDPVFLEKINPFWLSFPPPSASAHYTLGIIYLIMMVFGISGNALVIILFIKCRSLRTPANTLVINLAFSDLCMMCKAPLFIYNSFHEGPALGDFVCRMYGFIGAVTGTVSIATLTAISIDRYNVVVYPLNPLRSTTNLRSKLMVLFVWIYGLTFSIIPMLDIGLSSYVPEGFLTACSFDYLTSDINARIFMFIYFCFAWVLPFFIITYCYAKILKVVISANSIQSSKEKNKTEVKLAGVVVALIGLWFMAWTPYAVVALLGISGNMHLVSPLGSMIPAIFCKSAACIDPYLYAVNHPRYRQELTRMFCKEQNLNNSQFQTSHYTRGGRTLGVRDASEELETVEFGGDKGNNKGPRRGPLERGASSICDESDLSFSGDYNK